MPLWKMMWMMVLMLGEEVHRHYWHKMKLSGWCWNSREMTKMMERPGRKLFSDLVKIFDHRAS
jgi:hypothetical protein